MEALAAVATRILIMAARIGHPACTRCRFSWAIDLWAEQCLRLGEEWRVRELEDWGIGFVGAKHLADAF